MAAAAGSLHGSGRPCLLRVWRMVAAKLGGHKGWAAAEACLPSCRGRPLWRWTWERPHATLKGQAIPLLLLLLLLLLHLWLLLLHVGLLLRKGLLLLKVVG